METRKTRILVSFVSFVFFVSFRAYSFVFISCNAAMI